MLVRLSAVIAIVVVAVVAIATTTQRGHGGQTAPAAPAAPQTRPPVFLDDFNGTSIDTAKWSVYSGEGNGGNGSRSPSQITVKDGAATLACTTGGTCAGMATQHAQKYGRWEARVKASVANSVHPVLLLWPADGVFPAHGEADYMEAADPKRQKVDGFLHFGENDLQTFSHVDVDLTQWHEFSVTWTPQAITYYVDGRQWFQDTDSTHQPPTPMVATIQLDFANDHGPITPGATMSVDWLKIWAP